MSLTDDDSSTAKFEQIWFLLTSCRYMNHPGTKSAMPDQALQTLSQVGVCEDKM